MSSSREHAVHLRVHRSVSLLAMREKITIYRGRIFCIDEKTSVQMLVDHTFIQSWTHSDPFIRVCRVWKLPCHSQTHREEHMQRTPKHCEKSKQTVGPLGPSVTFHTLKEICNFSKSIFPCLTCKASYNIMGLFLSYANLCGLGLL